MIKAWLYVYRMTFPSEVPSPMLQKPYILVQGQKTKTVMSEKMLNRLYMENCTKKSQEIEIVEL